MFIDPPPANPDAERVYAASEKAQGFRMNLAAAWAWRPDVYEGFAALRSTLAGASGLSRRDQSVLTCAAASTLQDSYCSLAWGKMLASEAGASAAAAIISGTNDEALTRRDHALAAWARKVVAGPNSTTRADVDALRAEGFSDREIFEITAFVAFRLAFSTVNDALGVTPDTQLSETAPQELRQAVGFGRQPVH